MAIAFSRSLRALNNDRFRPSLLVLGVTLSILLAWVIWFFFGGVPLYETSDRFQLEPDGSMTVTFDAGMLTHIAPNQTVTLQVNRPEGAQTYNGVIERVEVATGQNQGTARVFLENASGLSQPTSGQVRVETETISPFAYALRAVHQPGLVPAASTTTP